MADNLKYRELRPKSSRSEHSQAPSLMALLNNNGENQVLGKIPQVSHNSSRIPPAHSSTVDHEVTTESPHLDEQAKLGVFNRWCPECEQKHTLGLFCWTCRSQPMEWLPGDIPSATNDQGERILVGPRWGMVEGVNLLDKEAIAVMSVVTYIDIFTYRYTDVPGFLELAKKHQKSVKAGQCIADVYQSLRRKALNPQDRNPEFHEIIHRALLEPHLTADEYELNVLNSFAPTPKEFIDDEAVEEDDGGNGDYDPAPNDDLLMQSRPILSASAYHVPGPRADEGDWEFVEGTDLSKAVLGVPEPHKFFLIRKKKSDPSIEDLREYPSWKEFNWSDPESIEALNKHRHQIAYRMGRRLADPRHLWTLREKEYLKDLVKADIDSGKTRKTLNWDDISTRLAAGFEGVVQKKGAPLAVKSELDEDNMFVTPEDRTAKLIKDREGPVARSGNAIKIQAGKYHDICVILDQVATPKKTLKRKRGPSKGGVVVKTEGAAY